MELADGRAERAPELLGASWTQREKEDYPLSETERPDYEAVLNEARSALGESNFAAAFAKG